MATKNENDKTVIFPPFPLLLLDPVSGMEKTIPDPQHY